MVKIKINIKTINDLEIIDIGHSMRFLLDNGLVILSTTLSEDRVYELTEHLLEWLARQRESR